MAIRLLICDWDDVFTFGSTAGYLACYHAAAVGVGVHLDADEELERIQSQWGKPHRIEIAALLAEHPDRVARACEIYEQHLFGDTFVDQLSIVPGAAELLTRLAGKYTLALVTGIHPRLLQERIFPKFDIPNVFDAICSTYDLAEPSLAKPHPYAAHQLMKQFDATPAETVVVGDAMNDAMLAVNSGATPIVVLTGHLDRAEAESLGVKYIIADVTQLESTLVNELG